MEQQDPTYAMLDQLLRILLMDVLHAVVWCAVAVVFIGIFWKRPRT